MTSKFTSGKPATAFLQKKKNAYLEEKKKKKACISISQATFLEAMI